MDEPLIVVFPEDYPGSREWEDQLRQADQYDESWNGWSYHGGWIG